MGDLFKKSDCPTVMPECFRLTRPRFADRAYRASRFTAGMASRFPLEARGNDSTVVG
jgi:hypothetical protein